MKHFISFCTFLLFSTLLFAQAERSLDECIRIAWKQNPSLRNSWIDIKEARMDYISSVASFLPRVSVSAEAGRNFGRSIDPNTNGYTNDTFDEGTVGLDMTLGVFNSLQDKKWIEPYGDSEGRKKEYHITAQGKEIAEKELARLNELVSIASEIIGGAV